MIILLKEAYEKQAVKKLYELLRGFEFYKYAQYGALRLAFIIHLA
jgi:hypothetical protein